MKKEEKIKGKTSYYIKYEMYKIKSVKISWERIASKLKINKKCKCCNKLQIFVIIVILA